MSDVSAVLIVAHGQPSDPAPAAAELAGFAARVREVCPERSIASVTLAEEGGLARAVATLGQAGLVFPMFMAGGWFTRVQLPAKLRAVGASGWQVLEPFGCAPELADLAVSLVGETGARQVILAAHGSFKSTTPSDIAYAVAEKIAAETGAEVRVGFIDQEPQLQRLRGWGEICLPFFAAAGGHVTEDVPAALASAGFAGRILPPIGLDPRAPSIAARAIAAGQPVCATACRYQRG